LSGRLSPVESAAVVDVPGQSNAEPTALANRCRSGCFEVIDPLGDGLAVEHHSNGLGIKFLVEFTDDPIRV
jgi:hypothetical protein